MGELISCTPATLILLNDKQNLLAEGNAQLVTPATAAGSSWKLPPNTGKAQRRNRAAQWETSPGTTGVFASTRVTAREEMRIFFLALIWNANMSFKQL